MNNLYHFDNSLETSVDQPTYINAGIKENVYLVRIEYNTTDNGNEFLAFYFTNKQGDKLSHTEWPPRSEVPFDQLNTEEKEALLKKVSNQKKRIGQIVKAYLPNETFDKKPESFKEYAEDIINLLKGKVEDVPVRVKIVYNDKNFTTLPMYWKYKFIEPMTVSAEESKIKILNIDKITRTVPNVKSSTKLEIEDQKGADGLAEVSAKNDLPF